MYMLPAEAAFAGFVGRCGDKLDALGIIFVGQSAADDEAMPCVCLGPAGGLGGNVFIDSPIPSDAIIRSIQIYSDSEVRGIGMTYQCNESVQAMPVHGSTDTPRTDFVLREKEYVKGISGKYGDRIDSLQIHTNLRTSALFGSSGGTVPYNFDVPAGVNVIGFVGRAGSSLDAIGCVGREEGRMPPQTTPVYRLSSSSLGEFYTRAAEDPGSTGYTSAGVAFHALAQPLMGTDPVYFFSQGAPARYYYTVNPLASPGPDWTNKGVAFYVFPMNDPVPGAAPASIYKNGAGGYVVRTNRRDDDLSGLLLVASLGYVFNDVVPVYRFVDAAGRHYYSISQTDPPDGFTAEGAKFFAFGTPVFGTVPTYSFHSGNVYKYTQQPGDYRSATDLIADGIAWYSYPASALAPVLFP